MLLSVINTTFTYDANGNMLSGNGLAITYTAFNKPETIQRGSNLISFDHDTERGRFRQISSVDLLSKSVAEYAGANMIGVILSGSLDDGSRDLASIHDAGGPTMVLTSSGYRHTRRGSASERRSCQNRRLKRVFPFEEKGF